MPTDNLTRTDEQSVELRCRSGAITVNIGDHFHRDEPCEDWTVAGFGKRFDEVVVMCKPSHRHLGWARQFEESDGTVAFCGDTVAAYML